MKHSILTLSIVAGLLSAAPVLQARDYGHDHYNDDLRSDVHSLWEWYGHLRDESNARGNRHTRDELESIRSNLKRVEDELNDHHHGDRVRGEIDGIRDDLRHVNGELNWHGEVHHRPGFTIDIR
jgi:hypothetical protein